MAEAGNVNAQSGSAICGGSGSRRKVCKRCTCTKEHCYSQVVVIGNGPSGICLSYILSGNWPYFTGEPHPDPYLQIKLKDDISILEQDLEYLSGGLEGRSRNPAALLFDTLHQPNADLGNDEKSRLEWRHHKDKAIQHCVLGKGQPGGSWREMDDSVLTLSLGKWMELPGVTFQEWIQSYREREASNNNLAEDASCETRASLGEVAKYYEEYVKSMDISENFIPKTKVTSVRRLKGMRVINCESGEPEIPCQGCRKFEGDNLFEVKGQHFYGSCGCSQDFTVCTPNVVVATGMLGIPNKLNVEGESLAYVYSTLKDLDNAVQQVEVHPKSDPILVVGSGLNAADAVLCALKEGIPVIHVFRRKADDPDIIYGKLPKSVYPEYHKMVCMMKHKSCLDGLYTAYEQHTVLEFMPRRQVRLKGPDDAERICKISLAIVMIGNRPNLSFLPNEGKHLGTHKGEPISGRENPIDVNPFTMECLAEPGLFALGPLVGDNFVRYAQGGCLSLTQHLAIKNGWVQDFSLKEDGESGDGEVLDEELGR